MNKIKGTGTEKVLRKLLCDEADSFDFMIIIMDREGHVDGVINGGEQQLQFMLESLIRKLEENVSEQLMSYLN